ncbi:CamS family sex pheromone protein [Lactobacillus ultunensis]|uniref:CamS family sex pheromone protein n=1 Tax=Lactobacillus ultunensis TaxID=227945 RepID=UPI0002F50A5B|nr:CamS family sex pheromone protein [Lactobacillus ultunensis]KRL81197.1 protein involved in sex pheromone biosynthesis [Lactobacillus ultunensis DSM 16047]QQP28145.1 CamS family sex pheromone protein [Lactobacillus ultunensis]
MRKYLQIIALAGVALTLSSCGKLKDSSLANNATTTSTTKKKNYQTTNTGNSGYSVLMKNGRYVTSPIAGLTATDNDNSVDTRELERGLIQISKNQFSTNQYVFQEGQQLDTSTVTDWLTRKSKSNPTGLNPASNGKSGSDNRTPIYLEEIVEQDYLTGSGSKYSLGGMSLGLAMNSVDYYQKKRDGAQFQTDISRAEQRAQGEKIANEIIGRLRKKKALKKIPITVGLFSKTGKDSLVGGTYFAYGTAAANSSKIVKWKSVSEKMQVLPTTGNEKAINSDDASHFNDFKTAIQNYFPNISGVTATLRYDNGKLAQENISITTQFYGYEQIQSFTRLVLSTAKKYLANNIPIEIKIGSVDDVQALIAKETGDSDYLVHVYGGE